MWDEEDGFYYDVLRLPDGSAHTAQGPLDGRSVAALRHDVDREVAARAHAQIDRGNTRSGFGECRNFASPSTRPVLDISASPNAASIGLVNEDRLRRILTRMLDENEFLSPYGIRALSRYHADHPYVFSAGGQEYRVAYLPAESDTGMFGGNSNWRGPDLDAGQRAAHPRAAALLLLLWRQFQNRVSDRLGQFDEPVRGGA